MKRFIIKTEKEKMRGQKGLILMYYGYDTKNEKRITASSPIKSDVQFLLDSYELNVLMKEITNE